MGLCPMPRQKAIALCKPSFFIKKAGLQRAQPFDGVWGKAPSHFWLCEILI
jgi:hypothetical protein